MKFRTKGGCQVASLVIILFLFIYLLAVARSDPPIPHNIQGRVFTDSQTGAANGVIVRLNNTNESNEIVFTETFAPPIPQLLGTYLATIQGEHNDTIEAYAWNGTHYGFNTTNLSVTTTSLNIVLENQRPAETNVTILFPSNDSLFDIPQTFNLTVNVSIIGGDDATNCNITLNLSNSGVINITADQNFTKQLGDISLGDHHVVRWNLSSQTPGATNMSVSAQCSSDGINFENAQTDSIENVTTVDVLPPDVTLITPTNNSIITAILNITNVLFSYSVSDGSPIRNCTLFINSTINVTNTSVVKDTPQLLPSNLSIGVYNWSVSCTDNSSQRNVGNSTVYTLFIIGSAAPVVSDMITPVELDLNPGSTLTFFCNATITDANNISDIVVVNATFFQESTGSGAPDDNNDHYSNASCVSLANSTYEGNYTCGFTLEYYANNGTWLCNITARDSVNLSGFQNLSSTVNELLAINISSQTIDFGSLPPTNISQDTVNITVTNIGNVEFNVSLEGYGATDGDGLAMVCDDGTIPLANQRYSINSSLPFSSMVSLTDSPVDIKNFTLQQRTIDNEFGLSRNSTHWRIEIPDSISGRCNGTVIYRTYLG